MSCTWRFESLLLHRFCARQPGDHFGIGLGSPICSECSFVDSLQALISSLTFKYGLLSVLKSLSELSIFALELFNLSVESICLFRSRMASFSCCSSTTFSAPNASGLDAMTVACRLMIGARGCFASSKWPTKWVPSKHQPQQSPAMFSSSREDPEEHIVV